MKKWICFLGFWCLLQACSPSGVDEKQEEKTVVTDGSVKDRQEEPGREVVLDAGKEAPPERRVTPDPGKPVEPGIPDAQPEPPVQEKKTEPVVPDTSTPDNSTPDNQPPVDNPPPPDRPVPTSDAYEKNGPFQTKQLPGETLKLPASSGCTGTKCSVSAVWTLPQGSDARRKAPYPLVIFSNGFQMKKEQYKSYAEHLASWGYVVLRYDVQGDSLLSPAKHDFLGKAIRALQGIAANKAQAAPLKGLLDTSKVVLVGHSRGGKVSALAARQNATVKAYVGIDPVDSNPPFGGGAISAVKEMSKVQAPVLLLGAELGGRGFQPCAPSKDNYSKFYNATTSTALEVMMKDVGHAQYIDNRTSCLSCALCTSGRTPDKTVQLWSRALITAWLEQSVRGFNASAYLKGTWLQGLVSGGKVVVRSKP